MKDRHFVACFLLGYFLSLDAAMSNVLAGATSFVASTAGLTVIAMTQKPIKNKEL